MEDIENISIQIENIHSYFSDYANRQVNYAYTLRNWLIGMYLFQIEQKGKERAEYGEKIYKNLAKKLKEKNIKGMSFMMLHSFKNFFLTYPSIIQLVTEQFQSFENEKLVIIQSMIGEFNLEKKAIRHSVIEQTRSKEEVKSIAVENPGLFISKISFTHILEFIKIENALQRSFYEIQTM